MNYTEKYHLPQWDETDRIMRADFNRMCADMEAGLLKTAQDAAAGIAGTAADAGTAAAEAAAAAAAAQATADQAVSAAAAAQATANAAYCPTNLPYVVGTYTGNNAEQTISVGFRPTLLLIARMLTRPETTSTRHACDLPIQDLRSSKTWSTIQVR